ncbi:hypothetical protein Efla_007020 [Eimeria flavescens]
MPAAAQELFVDYVKGVNRHAECIAIAPHAPLIATTTADAKVHVALESASTYFFNFREDTFSALDFWCKEQQKEGTAFLCGAMAADGRMVCFEVKYELKKITGMTEIHRSPKSLQKGVVAQLVASKGPWVITRSEGEDTEIRVHSYKGDLLAAVDTRQIQNLQLAVSGDGCFFGCAAWTPGVKIFEVKTKGGAFQKVEKALDISSAQGLTAFAISADRKRAASIDKSGRFALWRIDVRHNVGEESKLLCQTTIAVGAMAPSSLQFSVDGSLLILASGVNLHFYHAASLELFKAVEHAASHPLQHVLVAPNNKYLFLLNYSMPAEKPGTAANGRKEKQQHTRLPPAADELRACSFYACEFPSIELFCMRASVLIERALGSPMGRGEEHCRRVLLQQSAAAAAICYWSNLLLQQQLQPSAAAAAAADGSLLMLVVLGRSTTRALWREAAALLACMR